MAKTRNLKTFDLGTAHLERLEKLAKRLNPTPSGGGNATATMRRLIDQAYEREFGPTPPPTR